MRFEAENPKPPADDLPESAFMYVGTLDDARAKAEKMAVYTAGTCCGAWPRLIFH